MQVVSFLIAEDVVDMARPRKNIDREEFEKLCGLQCTQAEICDWFGVSDKLLMRGANVCIT